MTYERDDIYMKMRYVNGYIIIELYELRMVESMGVAESL